MARSWKINDVSESDDTKLRQIKARRVLRGSPNATGADIIREGVRMVWRREVQGRPAPESVPDMEAIERRNQWERESREF